MKKLAYALASGVAALGLLAGAQGVAQAEESAAVPSCVKGEGAYLIALYVTITNNCDTTQRVSAWYERDGVPVHPENRCYTLAPGEQVKYREPFWFGERYAGLIHC
ncbi:hypothetical protein [Streptomyces sp. NPDC051657]|uniref:hypothetical protein n=1 Tax=unclassified Streptomyces TaxID=2593676 RepID=UPI003426B6F2